MRTRLAALAWVLSAALAARPVHAGSAGAESFDFLLLDANARPAGLGGAYSALAQDANALQYNPAGLAGVCRSEATFMHNEYFQSISQEYVAVSLKEGIGFNLNYLDFGSIPQTTVSSPFGTGSRVGLSDLSLGAGYARPLSGGLSAGIGVKYLKEVIAGYAASGFAADLGLQYKAGERLSLGYSLQNVGPKVKFQSQKESLSRLQRLGAAYRLKALDRPLLLTADILKERSEGYNLAAGAELTLVEKLAVRLGYNTRNNAGPGFSLGLGWTQDRWSVDYAFVPFGDLGSANRMSVTWRFDNGCGKPAPVVAAAPPPPLPPAAPKPAPLMAPVNTRVVALDKTALTLAWDANGNAAGTSYRVSLASAADFSGARTASVSELQAAFGGLESGATYFLRAQAERGSELSAFDAMVIAVTLAVPPPPKCPNPPAGVPLDAEGCPKLSPAETSAMGTLTRLAAPGSVTAPIIAAVMGAAGDPSCPWERQGVLCMKLAMEFEYDKSDLKGDFSSQLHEIAAFLKSNPKAGIDLQGHTDNKGGLDHNIRLSRGRAKAVNEHLVNVESVDAARLTSQGLGFSKPAASNDTDEGRQRNRRVMAILEWK